MRRCLYFWLTLVSGIAFAAPGIGIPDRALVCIVRLVGGTSSYVIGFACDGSPETVLPNTGTDSLQDFTRHLSEFLAKGYHLSTCTHGTDGPACFLTGAGS